MIEWRPVVGWEGCYEVSDRGDVRSVERVIVRRNGTKQTWQQCNLAWMTSTTGYPVVSLRDTSNGRSRQARVHRLVAEAFLPPVEGRAEVNHIDGNKQNPALYNLEWVTSRENRQHAWRTGLRTREHLPIKRGEGQGQSKLTDAIVARARERYAAGEQIRPMAREYGVDAKTLRFAVKGRTWSHLLPAPPVDEKATQG